MQLSKGYDSPLPSLIPLLSLYLYVYIAGGKSIILRRLNALVSVKDSWQVAPDDILSDQYQRQTEGWSQSRQCIEQALQRDGPFQGILGYSQACL